MRLLGHRRSRSKLKNQPPEAAIYAPPRRDVRISYQSISNVAAKLPLRVLQRIFTFVCPHVQDETYTTSEESMIENGCMLCDLRDLASCGRVCRLWFNSAQNLLYHSVRLDAVHYCEREIQLSQKRKYKSFFERNGEPKDATQQRLELFSQTVRAKAYLGALVQVLKMPYMTRETCKADLARAVSGLPNLRYVDLPEGFFNQDPTTVTLRQELEHRCSNLRKIKYLAGSEGSFSMLAHSRQWPNLEILEISGLQVEPDTLLYALASFPALREVKLGDIASVDDTILIPSSALPHFPPIATLTFEDTPSITALGLVAYLSRPETREVLANLQLTRTGVAPQNLHEILAVAPHLTNLIISATVSRSFPLAPVPPLASRSLRTLQFEIYPSSSVPNPPSETYYTYLASSLLSSSLPSLTSLFALSPSLPDLLLFPPPTAPFAGNNAQNSRLSTISTTSSVSSGYSREGPGRPKGVLSGLVSPLSLYTKPALAPELEWLLTTIDPPGDHNGRRGSASATRPISLDATGQLVGSHSMYGGMRKNSVMVGNGFGGFLAVPSEESTGRRPGSAGSRRGSASTGNEWMG